MGLRPSGVRIPPSPPVLPNVFRNRGATVATASRKRGTTSRRDVLKAPRHQPHVIPETARRRASRCPPEQPHHQPPSARKRGTISPTSSRKRRRRYPGSRQEPRAWRRGCRPCWCHAIEIPALAALGRDDGGWSIRHTVGTTPGPPSGIPRDVPRETLNNPRASLRATAASWQGGVRSEWPSRFTRTPTPSRASLWRALRGRAARAQPVLRCLTVPTVQRCAARLVCPRAARPEPYADRSAFP